MLIDEKTKLTGSIAIKQTGLGPAMHNAAFAHLGLNYLYIPFKVTSCKQAVLAIKTLSFVGIAVSQPYKQEILKYLDRVDHTAKKIGAVNTVINHQGILSGFNSDWIGAINALEEATALSNKNVALVGAGGAARAIAYGLKQRKSNVTVYNRSESRGLNLAKTFGQNFGGKPESIRRDNSFDIIINATSVGYDDPKETILKCKNLFHKNTVVLDIVFSPLETTFLKVAKSSGCITIPGYRMLIHQALFQFQKFTGEKAPFSIMEQALKRQLK